MESPESPVLLVPTYFVCRVGKEEFLAVKDYLSFGFFEVARLSKEALSCEFLDVSSLPYRCRITIHQKTVLLAIAKKKGVSASLVFRKTLEVVMLSLKDGGVGKLAMLHCRLPTEAEIE